MNQNKLNLTQALVVEGKYDAARLANLVDATILTTDGFAIFKDKTMQVLFKRIAAAQGMILLTDSDAAGFKIRHYITGLVGPQNVLQAYIPAVPGKEPRKPEPGKEGLLGVEGVDDALILQGLHTALAAAPLQAQQQNTDPITYTDLYELKAALLAVKENSSLPVLASMSFEAGGGARSCAFWACRRG